MAQKPVITNFDMTANKTATTTCILLCFGNITLNSTAQTNLCDEGAEVLGKDLMNEQIYPAKLSNECEEVLGKAV